MSENKGKIKPSVMTVRVQSLTKELIDRKALAERAGIQEVLETLLQWWLHNPAVTIGRLQEQQVSAFMRTDGDARKIDRSLVAGMYREENIPWHEKLEEVLNDPDEKIGIQKNLEWAENSVRQKRISARRKSGS
jgi:lipoate-protein ligase A